MADLIDRKAARQIVAAYSTAEGVEDALDAIAALPAQGVRVKPLEWFEVERGNNGYGKWTAEGYTVRKIEGLFLLDFAGNGKNTWRFITSDAAKAAAQDDHTARIMAAIDAPDVAELVEAAEPFADYMTEGMDMNAKGEPLPDSQGVGWVYLTHGHFRRLRAALAAIREAHEQRQ